MAILSLPVPIGVGVGIGIGIDFHCVLRRVLMNPAAARHTSSFSCPNPILLPFDADPDSDVPAYGYTRIKWESRGRSAPVFVGIADYGPASERCCNRMYVGEWMRGTRRAEIRGLTDRRVAGILSVVMNAIEMCADRPDWDTYFMNIAKAVATRGNCLRRQVGAVIVRDRRIVSTGYNGTPRGARNCFEGGCARCAGTAASGQALGECICSHAEENAVSQAAYHGIRLNGSTLYCTLSPCLSCAKLIINAGIVEVVYDEAYELSVQTGELLKSCNVRFRKLTD